MKDCRRRLNVEMLESRDCPATMATVMGGNLIVLSANDANLNIQQIDGDSYSINGQIRHGVTGSMSVNVASFGTAVLIDFNGHGTIQNVDLRLATQGKNIVTIQDGTIRGNVNIFGSPVARDRVMLGNDSLAGDALTVNGSANMNLGGGNDFAGFDDLTTVNRANINLGPGNDAFCLKPGAVITGGLGAAQINGGAGFDTFRGTASPAFLFVSQVNFEAFQPIC